MLQNEHTGIFLVAFHLQQHILIITTIYHVSIEMS